VGFSVVVVMVKLSLPKLLGERCRAMAVLLAESDRLGVDVVLSGLAGAALALGVGINESGEIMR
jgi:hypothetical protein